MIGLGLVATLGQYLLYEGFRHAPASALARWNIPGSSGLFVWLRALGEVPSLTVVIGALMIVASSGILVIGERRRPAEA